METTVEITHCGAAWVAQLDSMEDAMAYADHVLDWFPGAVVSIGGVKD